MLRPAYTPCRPLRGARVHPYRGVADPAVMVLGGSARLMVSGFLAPASQNC
ncbi:hypothetical protein HNR15_002018 [Allobranchiibius huperziae]|uniref:Uncharacterized protein n=1 Tax=Allobranchiibius huperziae TaxID=1874116 RepID=A0A853DLQ3_9MICO|nr:hypothetical protein [Allobranchiibius huperziae]